MVYKKPNSNNWYYKFQFRGAPIQESTRQANKRVAEQMAAAHKTRLAKAQVGIVERPPAPTVKEFAPRFLVHVRVANANKPATVTFYENRTATLVASPLLSKLPMDAITSEHVTALVKSLRAKGYEVSTVNRNPATLRKMMRLLSDWDGILCRRVKLLPDENRRERVLLPEEEAAYLSAAEPLLTNVATLILDCGLRPEEVHQLTKVQYRNGSLTVFRGKQTGSRRRVEATPRVAAILDALLKTLPNDTRYLFPAPTKTGHINADSYKGQHKKALEESKVSRFVIYSLRHTAVTNLAMTGLDAPSLMYWAGHKDLATTMRYIHLAADVIQKRVRDARGEWAAKSGASSGPTHEVHS